MSENGISASAAAIPSNREILEAYCEWLHLEKRLLCTELCPDNGTETVKLSPCAMIGQNLRSPVGEDWRELSQPSTRAGVVLAAVGLLPGELAASVEHSSLPALIEHHKAANEAFTEVAAEMEALPDGNIRKAELELVFSKLSDLEDEALLDLCGHKCTTMGEAQRKSEYILESTDIRSIQEEHFEALLRSFLP